MSFVEIEYIKKFGEAMNIFKKKSDNNLEISQIAAAKEYYHIAISRQYYSLFQLMIYVIDSFFKSEYPNKVSGKSSHDIRLCTLREIAYKNKEKYGIDEKEFVHIRDLYIMKELRVDSDYKVDQIKEKEYDLSTKYYSMVSNVLKRIINKEANNES
jgi:hypothetical protein